MGNDGVASGAVFVVGMNGNDLHGTDPMRSGRSDMMEDARFQPESLPSSEGSEQAGHT